MFLIEKFKQIILENGVNAGLELVQKGLVSNKATLSSFKAVDYETFFFFLCVFILVSFIL